MVQNSIVKRTREAKKAAGVAAIAMKMAKDHNDINAKKANKYKKLFIAAKTAVLRKYGNMAKTEWAKKQASSNTGSSTKTPSNK